MEAGKHSGRFQQNRRFLVGHPTTTGKPLFNPSSGFLLNARQNARFGKTVPMKVGKIDPNLSDEGNLSMPDIKPCLLFIY